MDRRRVVVTGMGVVSPVGNNIECFWDSIRQGVSGIGPITRFDCSQLASRVAAQVKDFDPLLWIDPKNVIGSLIWLLILFFG